MFSTICSLIPEDRDFPERARRLDLLRRVLDGTLYEVLPYPFHDERNGSGEYVPIRQRRPSVRYGICREVVERSVGMLFGEGRFPELVCQDRATAEALADLVKEGSWQARLSEAAIRGSIGSVVLVLRVLRGRVFLECYDSVFLTPEFDPEAPDVLVRVTEARKVKGYDLRDLGYPVPQPDLHSTFWFRREWGIDAETWYFPQSLADASEGKPPVVDTSRTVAHPLGFVPAVWIVNLPGGTAPDGRCTFRPAVETQIEIEYQLSQAGRGLKYSADPLLCIREPAAPDGDIIRSAGNALIVSEKGDAKLLEIGGTAAAAVVEFCRALREWAMESMHGDRSSPDKLTAATSGKAMELLNAPLISLADRLRTSYGEHGLLPLARMVALASHKVPLRIAGKDVRNLSPDISLRWHGWFSDTHQDTLAESQAIIGYTTAGLLSKETAVGALADVFDIEDVPAELARLKSESAEADAREVDKTAALAKAAPKPAAAAAA